MEKTGNKEGVSYNTLKQKATALQQLIQLKEATAIEVPQMPKQEVQPLDEQLETQPSVSAVRKLSPLEEIAAKQKSEQEAVLRQNVSELETKIKDAEGKSTGLEAFVTERV